MPIRKLKFNETSVLYLFLVCLLMFIFCTLASWKCDFCTLFHLSIGSASFILNNFGSLGVSIRVAIWNIYKARIFPGWLETCLLETSAFIFKYTVHHCSVWSYLIPSFHIPVLCFFFSLFFSCSLMRVYTLMPSINMPIRKLKVSGNVSSLLVSYVFDDVHFLRFGEVKILFLHISPFR